MSTGGARRGRRDNGLEAAEYAAAGDVDPRVGEHLLDALAAGGIAAYLQPSADLHPVTRTTTMPSRPMDRLYVDRRHLSTAREYLAQVAEPPAGTPVAAPVTGATAESGTGSGDSSVDMDAAWARIVADLKADLDPQTSTWPDPTDQGSTETRPGSENPDERSGATPAAEPDDRLFPRDSLLPGRSPGSRPADEPSLLDGLDTFGADLPGDDGGSYVPPPPPPLPRLSKVAVVAMLAIIAGFILFLWPTLAPFDENLGRLVGFGGCAAGVIALIWRLRPGDDDDEDYRDPDNGAVV